MYRTISAIFTIPSPTISSVVCVESTQSHEHLPQSEVRLEIVFYCDLNPDRKLFYVTSSKKNFAKTDHESGKRRE